MNRWRLAALLVAAVAAAIIAPAPLPAQDQGPGHVVQGEGGLITALVIDPAATSTIYATTARGLYKTVDGGRTWLAHGDGLGKHSVLALAVDPASRGLFAATDSGGVFRSLDGSGRWSAANTGLETRWIGAVAFDPKSHGVVYAGTEAGRLFRSVNGGQEWIEMKAPIPQVALSAIAVDPVDSNIIHVGTNSQGTFRTVDGGVTWTRPTDRMKRGTIWNITIDPANPSRVYAGTHDGLFKSTDRGVTWTGISKGMQSYNVLALAVDPSHSDTLYAATAIGIYKSPDAGSTWSLLRGDLYVSALVVDPRDPSLLYAGTHMGVLKSVDAGAKWVSLDFASRKDDTLTAVDGTAGPLPALPRRGVPTASGLKPLPVRPLRPPVSESPKAEAVAAAGGVTLPARLSPVSVGHDDSQAATPIALTISPRRPVGDEVAGVHAPVTRPARDLAHNRNAALASFEAMTSRRPNVALHRAWAQTTGLHAMPVVQPLRRLPVTQGAAGSRARTTVSSGR